MRTAYSKQQNHKQGPVDSGFGSGVNLSKLYIQVNRGVSKDNRLRYADLLKRFAFSS